MARGGYLLFFGRSYFHPLGTKRGPVEVAGIARLPEPDGDIIRLLNERNASEYLLPRKETRRSIAFSGEDAFALESDIVYGWRMKRVPEDEGAKDTEMAVIVSEPFKPGSGPDFSANRVGMARFTAEAFAYEWPRNRSTRSSPLPAVFGIPLPCEKLRAVSFGDNYEELSHKIGTGPFGTYLVHEVVMPELYRAFERLG